ncbi:MAG: hypothetical protein WKF30_15960 [Pyrinomonadaceae bacterium]
MPSPAIFRPAATSRRCPHRMPRCAEGRIPLYALEQNVSVRCVLFDLAAAVTIDKQTGAAVVVKTSVETPGGVPGRGAAAAAKTCAGAGAPPRQALLN